MANKRSRPGGEGVRKSASVGPDYPASHWEIPWNVGIDSVYGVGDDKTLLSPTSTPEAMGAFNINEPHDYDSYWEHGTRAVVSHKSKHRSSRWTPRGKGDT